MRYKCHFSWQVHYLVKFKCHFSWQVHYLVKFKCHFSWQVHYLVKFKCHFSWQVQHLVKFKCHFSWQAQHLVKFKCHFSWQVQYFVKFDFSSDLFWFIYALPFETSGTASCGTTSKYGEYCIVYPFLGLVGCHPTVSDLVLTSFWPRSWLLSNLRFHLHSLCFRN